MTKAIGCFHAHASNIEHIEQALRGLDVELVHFVDPGLDRMKHDAAFTNERARRKVTDTLRWIEQSHVDAIVVTCTFFGAVLEEEPLDLSVPMLRIDEPLFQEAMQWDRPLLLAFTNAATVDGSMKQLLAAAAKQERTLRAEARLLDHTFELLMRGEKEAYLSAVAEGLARLAAEHPSHQLIAAQLSMVPAAREVEAHLGRSIGNPLDALARQLIERLHLESKT